MRFFDLGRLYTDWDMALRGKKCLLSDSVDAIIDSVERAIAHPPFSEVDSDEEQVVMAVPHDNGYEDAEPQHCYRFYAEEDVNGCNQVYRYCYLLPEDGDE